MDGDYEVYPHISDPEMAPPTAQTGAQLAAVGEAVAKDLPTPEPRAFINEHMLTIIVAAVVVIIIIIVVALYFFYGRPKKGAPDAEKALESGKHTDHEKARIHHTGQEVTKDEGPSREEAMRAKEQREQAKAAKAAKLAAEQKAAENNNGKPLADSLASILDDDTIGELNPPVSHPPTAKDASSSKPSADSTPKADAKPTSTVTAASLSRPSDAAVASLQQQLVDFIDNEAGTE